MFLSHEPLRALKAHAPEIVERLINLQGSSGFDDYVDGVLREESVSAGGRSGEIASALAALKAEHARSFPSVAVPVEARRSGNFADDDKFLMIAARFPHIARNLRAKWGSRAFRDYVDGLFIDTRGGRQGFPSEILFALFDLRERHEKEFPRCVPEVTNVWSQVG